MACNAMQCNTHAMQQHALQRHATRRQPTHCELNMLLRSAKQRNITERQHVPRHAIISNTQHIA
eukprot:5661283-Lingulodinium_polyedra.AAC.1